MPALPSSVSKAELKAVNLASAHMDPSCIQRDSDVGLGPEAVCAKRDFNIAEVERQILWLIRQLPL